MVRTLTLAIAILAVAVEAQAQDWAKEMFETTQHNFGTVARDAKTEYRFKVTNPFKDDVHLAGIRTSCGCTTPTIVKDTLKHGESTEIIAHFNTDRFSGKRGATLTVTIDKPQKAQVQLRVDGVIMTDVALTPGTADFGNLDQGASAEKTITVKSRRDLNVTSARAASPYIEAEVVPQNSKGGKDYIVKIRVKDAPAGYISDTVWLVTADGKAALTLPVEGRVVASLTASPTNLTLGQVTRGQTVTKQLVVNGKQPFRILGVKCEDSNFKFHVDDEAKTVHVIQVEFTAQQAGKVHQKICIETDMGDHLIAELSAFADVVELAGTP